MCLFSFSNENKVKRFHAAKANIEYTEHPPTTKLVSARHGDHPPTSITLIKPIKSSSCSQNLKIMNYLLAVGCTYLFMKTKFFLRFS